MWRSRSVERELMQLRARISLWRENRQGRGMPAELWYAAAAAARRLGVSRVATALGLGYVPLKARAGSAQPQTAENRPAFVEVSGAHLLAPATAGAVKIELARGEARMTITLPTASGLDISALLKTFANA